MGKNWNSTIGEWTDVKSDRVKDLAVVCRTLKSKGKSVKEIAQLIDKSEGRVYELLR